MSSSLETQVALGDALDPVTSTLAALATMSLADRRAQRSGLVQLVLAAASGLGPTDSRCRASYFVLSGGSETREMVHQASLGRSTPAKARFTVGTAAGDAALTMVDERGYIYCDDVSESPPPGWEPTERGEYKCFILSAGGSRNVDIRHVDSRCLPGGRPHQRGPADSPSPRASSGRCRGFWALSRRCRVSCGFIRLRLGRGTFHGVLPRVSQQRQAKQEGQTPDGQDDRRRWRR